MSAATRTCGACGGNGYQRHYEFPGTKLCPVCAGSGREPDLERLESEEALAIVEAYSATDEDENR